MYYNQQMITYISALVVLTVVLFAHMSGIEGLYYTVDRYDVLMHLMGGVGIGLFVTGLLQSYRAGDFLKYRNVITGVILIGFVWEFFEIYYQLTGHPLWTKLYYIDTVKDLIMDTIGGGFVVAGISLKAYMGGKKEPIITNQQ